ncbi:MAG: cytochrome c3 family protein [Myxococcota bacterium]
MEVKKIYFISVVCTLLSCVAAVSYAGDGGEEESGGVDSATCLECHSDKALEAATERGKGLKLFVDKQALDASVHKELSCDDCHGGAKEWSEAPHNEGKPLELLCKNCHKDVNAQYDKSIHGINFARGDKLAATCANCHGSHNILSSKERASKTNKFNLHKTCGECHQNPIVLEKRSIHNKEAVSQFIDSIHGKALLIDGLIVAPSCNDCHGVHNILPHSHPDSLIYKDTVPKTCGKCHVLVEDIYNESVHGRLLKDHDARGPVCITCHTSHKIHEPTGPEFRLVSDQMCGNCHKQRLENYRDTFHGKALALGREGVAACYDCHGHHDIQESKRPTSYISEEKRVETCKKCHKNANKNFAQFIVHADHTNKEEYPILYYAFLFMTTLLLGTFAFFAVHTLMWLFRSFALFMGDSKDWREQKKRIKEDRVQYSRFKPIDRFLHGLVITSFLLLVFTGMPLKFFYTDWAKWLLDIMGGQVVAALLHRVGAIITLFYFSVHIIYVLIRFFSDTRKFRNPQTGKIELRRIAKIIFGPDSPMPTLQDLKDMIAHNKWFFGGGEKPQFDRWTYWEKFDYLAVFWGVAIIGFSGLIMWFPEAFTTLFPGWIINVALIVHSDEALLAAGFIFTFHFFNVHFRPEKFPMDPVIFSGRISETELVHERKRLYDRWKESGELEKHKAKDEWESWKWIALPAGFIAFCLGVVLVILIYQAMYTRLIAG